MVSYQRRTGLAPIVGSTPVAQAFTFSLGGKTPKGAIFRVTSGTVLGTKLSPARLSEGCTDGTTHRACGMMSENGTAVGSTDSGFLQDNATVLQLPGTTDETREAEAEFVSFAADTVNIRWPTLPASAVEVECIVVFDDDAACKVFDFTGAASITAGSDFVDVTGLGFTLGHCWLWSTYGASGADQSGASARVALGWITHLDGVIKQTALTHYDRDRSSIGVNVVSALHDNCCIKKTTVGTTGTTADGARLSCTSVGSDGLRLTTLDVAESVAGFGLAIKTNRQKVWTGIPAATTTLTGTSGTHAIQDPGFKAKDVCVRGVGHATKNSTVNGSLAGRFCDGGSDGTTPVCATYQVQQNAATANSSSAMSSSFARVINNTTDDWVAALVLGDSLGFSSNITTASSANRLAAFLVLSDEKLEIPDAVALPLALPAVARLLTETPAARTLPLVLPAVARLLTETPAALTLPLVLPAVARLLTETPAARTLPLVLPAVARLLTETPAALTLPLVLPAPFVFTARAPAAVALPLVLPAPQRLVFEVPSAAALLLSVPAPSLRRTVAPLAVNLHVNVAGPNLGFPFTPAALHLALALPAIARLLTATPAAVQLALFLPAPTRVVTPAPTRVALALVLPAIARLLTETPSAVHLALALPAPALLLTVAPSSVALTLQLAAPTFGAQLELVLEVELARAAALVCELVRARLLDAEAPRRLDLAALLE